MDVVLALRLVVILGSLDWCHYRVTLMLLLMEIESGLTDVVDLGVSMSVWFAGLRAGYWFDHMGQCFHRAERLSG